MLVVNFKKWIANQYPKSKESKNHIELSNGQYSLAKKRLKKHRDFSNYSQPPEVKGHSSSISKG